MKNYRLKIQYDGTRYRGWQRQRNSADTIQGRIEAVLGRLTGTPVEICGAGRTDAGVHARCQVANVRLKKEWEPAELRHLMNEYLPEDIQILDISEAGERFHSRLNVVGKVYEYHLICCGECNVFARKYSWQMERELDVERMRRGAALLLGKHDFRGFCTRPSAKKSTVRRIDSVTIREEGPDIYLRFEGNGFLYHMVRILTGTLVEIGAGTRPPEDIRKVLETGDRSFAGVLAPAKGLTLLEVTYD